MNKRTLGRTGIKVSEISFGGVEIGCPYGIGVNSEADMISQSEAIGLIREALDRGINFFDTAHVYGKSEMIIGRALRDRRNQAVLCTKCGSLLDEKGRLLPQQEIAKVIDQSFQQSLQNLQTDYLDVYMIHNANREILDNPDILEIMTRYRQKGPVRSIGLSVYTGEETEKAIQSDVWDVIQLPIHLMDQRHSEHFTAARQRNIALVARSVLFKGILTDRGRDLHPALASVIKHREKCTAFLGKDVPSLSQLATKFVLSFPEITSVLVGIDRADYLHAAVEVADGGYFDESRMSLLRKLQYPDPDFLDLTEWRKKGWLT